ncbi:MAG TPA: glycosyltransferase family 39 protein [Anaerolineales bacterium]
MSVHESALHRIFRGHSIRLSRGLVHAILFVSILSLGTFARLWEYRKLPPGLNVDEASIGVDAYDLSKYGVDRNGVSYPTQFIAFGQEQNALYGYLLVPLVGAFGLRTVIVRLPMLVFALFTLPVIYVSMRRHFSRGLGLLSMFVIAISPWHVMLSRWGLDVNTFPFVLTLGFVCMLETARNDKWFVPACVFLGLCFYTYGPSYLIVPFFLATSAALLLHKRLLSWRYAIAGIALFCLFAIPIALFLAINTFKLDSVHFGPVTIPRLPTAVPRFLSATQGLHGNFAGALLTNLERLAAAVVLQTDDTTYNVLNPYGYFYGITFPLVALGVAVLYQRFRHSQHIGSALVLLLLTGCLLLGVLQPVNVNRINSVFIPLLLLIAAALDWIWQRHRWIRLPSVLILLAAFVAFNAAYHSARYAQVLAAKFRPGLLSAVHFASTVTPGPVCVTDEPGQAYIFVLFSEKLDPKSYLQNIKYVDVATPERFVASMSRYTFGRATCPLRPQPAYVLYKTEMPPQLGNKYAYEFFGNYVVYYLKP